jgi:hypothetical protein
MKRAFDHVSALLIVAAMSLAGCTLRNENPVPPENPKLDEIASSAPQDRNVLLEEYPGVACGYSPDGDVRAKAVKDAFPGRVAVIAVHAGYWATPKPPTLPDDYRTPFGDALLNQTKYTGIPAGTINRHYFSGGSTTGPYFPMQYGSMALNRSGWMASAPEIMGLPSPVNIGIRPTWDAVSRTLNVIAETYYTATDSAENYLNVALVENGIVGAQADFYASGGLVPAYVHNNVLRYFLTGQWGEKIADTKMGARTRRTYSYVVPSKINIDSCKVTVFVTQGRAEVLNVLEVSARP